MQFAGKHTDDFSRCLPIQSAVVLVHVGLIIVCNRKTKTCLKQTEDNEIVMKTNRIDDVSMRSNLHCLWNYDNAIGCVVKDDDRIMYNVCRSPSGLVLFS